MRTLIDIPEDDIRWLDRKAATEGKSRAALVREAVAAYREDAGSENEEERRLEWLRAGFGLWKGRTDIGDAVEWQRRERASWTRPWHDDYEEVKAEFPDLFDEEDDRQRRIYLQMRASKEQAKRRRA
ncbi:MAG: ribbon-helix-helix protein, CopG family [Sphingosinicella sp.]